MAKLSQVLLWEKEGQTIRCLSVDENNVPESLNGESGFHVCHVQMLTELILEDLRRQGDCGLSEEQIRAIALASSLHDIGKTQIPKSILDFPGKLSPVEYDIIKKHSVFGEAIINAVVSEDVSSQVLRFAAEIARSHHERIDATGYPDGLKGEQIPLSAQVVALADSFDALTSSRSYKEAFSRDVAVQMISSGMCGVFDEKLVDSLLRVVNHSSLAALRERVAKKRAVVTEAAGFVPERVLCIGNTQYLTSEFVKAAFPESKVTVVGNTELGSADKIKLFRVRKPSVQALLETYPFDLIVFFSGALTFHSEEKDDSEELREVLEYAKELQKEAKIIFLSSLDGAFDEKNDRGILSSAKEELCRFYTGSGALDVKVIRIPYLYSGCNPSDFLHSLFEELWKKKHVVINESPEARLRFLSLSDLACLLSRVVDHWKSGDGILCVDDEFGLRFRDLGDRLCSVCGGTVEYAAEGEGRRIRIVNKVLRNEYGWFAKISLTEQLEEEYERFLVLKREKTLTWKERLKRWLEKHSLLLKLGELILLFLLTELLLACTDSAVVFSIVDFRMAYIVIMATVHGLNWGLGAAFLSCASWLVAKVASGTDLLTVFYEPTNWLPFVFFVLVGALCGYVKLRKDDTIRFVSEQNRLLEDKLAFMRDIYEDTYREKRDLKKQIIGSKDSFGKIFDITRKLDTVEPHRLYLRIMETFEDVLENKSITVYSVNKQSKFGRLEVASRDILDTVARSVSTETYAQILSTLAEGRVWRNTELKSELPMYAAGVYRGKELVLLIFLWHAGPQQRSLYYVNLFKILCDLVQMSFLRAYEYAQAVFDERYIKNTHIRNAEAFEECLQSFRSLADKKVSSFLLLEFEPEGRSYEQMDALLAPKVRANDVLGIGADGKPCLLLSQASEKELPYILPRFEALGLSIRVL